MEDARWSAGECVDTASVCATLQVFRLYTCHDHVRGDTRTHMGGVRRLTNDTLLNGHSTGTAAGASRNVS